MYLWPSAYTFISVVAYCCTLSVTMQYSYVEHDDSVTIDDYCLFSFLIFSLLATSSVKLNLNLKLRALLVRFAFSVLPS